MKVKPGDIVTCKRRTQAYYSKYAGHPECFFEPGDKGTVVHIDVPYPRKNQCFSVVDFRKEPAMITKVGIEPPPWRVDLTDDNIVLLEQCEVAKTKANV